MLKKTIKFKSFLFGELLFYIALPIIIYLINDLMANPGDERDLLKRVANGDRNAFSEIYSQYLHDLYHYVYLFTKSKDTSEEIIQTVFVSIWEQRANLKKVNYFKGYLFKCAKNLLLDEIRRNQIQKNVFAVIQPTSEISSESSDGNFIYKEYYQIAQDAISLLPEKRKQIVELRIKNDLSLDEIAQTLSISKSVVKKQLYAGMAFIRAYLRKYAEFNLVVIPLLVFLS